MFRKFAQKLLGTELSVLPQVSKTFAEPDKAGFYLSMLEVLDGQTADVCRVRGLINHRLDRNHVRHDWYEVGNFPLNMLEAVRAIGNGQAVTCRKDNLLEYVVRTTGVLPLPPAANQRKSLVAKLNREQIERLKSLVPQPPQPSAAPRSQSDALING